MRRRHPTGSSRRKPVISRRSCGAKNAAAFDVGAACSGFVFALSTAEGIIAAEQAEHVLVIAAGEAHQASWTGVTGRRRCCSATAPARRSSARSTNGRGILSVYLKTDGTLAELLYRPGAGATHPPSEELLKDHSYYIKMAGREVFKGGRALDGGRLRPRAATRRSRRRRHRSADSSPGQHPHHRATAKHAGMPMDKVYVNVDRFGNTSAASIAIALDEAVKTGRLKPGMVVMLCAFRGGFTWGSMVVRLVSTIWLCPGQGAQKVGMGKDLRSGFRRRATSSARSTKRSVWRCRNSCSRDQTRSSTATQNANRRFSRTGRGVRVVGEKAVRRWPRRAFARRVLGLRHGGRVGRARSGEAGPAARRADAKAGEERRVRWLLCSPRHQGSRGGVRGGVATGEAWRRREHQHPDQTVISAIPEAVTRAGEACKKRGAKRVIPLKVSGAFHSPLMGPRRTSSSWHSSAPSSRIPPSPWSPTPPRSR